MSPEENKEQANSNESPKKLSQESLVRIFRDIKESKGGECRFCFVIGAGASKSSGIPTGEELAQRWYKELTEYLSETELVNWKSDKKISFKEETMGAFYPQIYEKRFAGDPKIGHEKYQSLMEGKDPSLGYVILSQILTKEKHNFVISTNFDYLVEDAIRMYTPKTPFVAGHESLAGFVTVQTDRPTIIKIHRDVFLAPFNSENETQTLKEEWKKTLSPILRDFNLLVIGYGGNDASLMNYLCEISLSERKPIYWCIRNEEERNKKINELLKKTDYLVHIGGFDELMHKLYTALEYEILNGLDKPNAHPLVAKMRTRVADLEKKLSELISEQEGKKQTPLPPKELFAGALRFAYRAYKEKDKDKADKIYKHGLEKYPNNPILLGLYANFLNNIRHNYDKAEKYYKKSLELDPTNVNNLGNYAVFLSNIRHDHDKAEGYYKRALELYPADVTNLANYALFLTNIRKDYDKAEEYYKKALELDPTHVMILGNYALFLTNIRKDYDKGEEYYKKAIELDPTYVNALNNYALFLTDIRRDYDKAGEYYQQVLKLDPTNVNNLGNYAHFLILSRQDFIAAEKYIDKAFELSADNNPRLLAELWFYRYAHYEQWREGGEKELERLTSLNAKSIGWNLEAHVEIAKKNKHPHIQKLQAFADLITKE